MLLKSGIIVVKSAFQQEAVTIHGIHAHSQIITINNIERQGEIFWRHLLQQLLFINRSKNVTFEPYFFKSILWSFAFVYI